MDSDTLLARITDYENRPNPYPLYAELREAGPVVRQADGSYLIGTYHEIAALLHDPRMSADPRSRTAPSPSGETVKPPFLRLDDPEHHRLRTLAMRPFGPPHSPGRVDAMRGEISQLTEELMGAFHAGGQIDIVDDFAYPLPVTVICRLLGVPREDEPLFRAWSDALVASADVKPDEDSPSRTRRATRRGSRWAGTWWTSPNSAVATRATTCFPPSSTSRIRPCGSPARTSRKPPCCC